MAREITPTIELGLGGSLLGKVLADYDTFGEGLNASRQIWTMFASRSQDGATWSLWSVFAYGRTSGNQLVIEPSSDTVYPTGSDRSVGGGLPEGGCGIRLDGATGYLESAIFANFSDSIPDWTLEVVFTPHTLPSGGTEPAIAAQMNGQFGLTLTSAGVIRGWHNGNAVVSSSAITAGEMVHVALSRTKGSPNDTVTLVVNGTTAASATPATFSESFSKLILGKHWTNSHFLEATYALCVAWPTALGQPRLATHAAAAQWTEVTNDCRHASNIVIERGIKDDSPIARVAATGTCSFGLDNSEKNSASLKGYYTPGHANCRTGFAKGIPCRVTMTVGSTDYTQFVGRVRRIAPTANEHGDRITAITATDWMDEAARYRLVGASILEDVRADQVAAAILDRMPNQPSGVTLHPCSETYELALDNTSDENTSALSEFVRGQNSEVGRTYISRVGSFVWESRYTRPMFYGDVVADINARMIGLDAAEITDTSINRVQVTVHPRRVDDNPTTVLFSIERPIAILSGETQTITGTYVAVSGDGQAAERVGGLNMQAPTYAAFEFDDASGSNNTADLTVGTRFDANTVTFTLTNTRTAPNPISGEATIYVTTLSVSGRGSYDFQPIVLIAEDAEAIASNGVNAVAFDMGYQQEPGVGQAIANALLAAYQQEGMRARSVTLCANDEGLPADLLSLDVSARVALTEYMTAIDAEYHINGERIEYSSGVKCDVTWWLATTAEGDALMAWQDMTYSAANFTAASGNWTVDALDQVVYSWNRPGPDSMVVAFTISGSDVTAAAAHLRIAIPGGFLAARSTTVGHFRYSDAAGTVGIGFIRTTAGTGYLQLFKAADAAWTITAADNTSIAGTTCSFEIQT